MIGVWRLPHLLNFFPLLAATWIGPEFRSTAVELSGKFLLGHVLKFIRRLGTFPKKVHQFEALTRAERHCGV